MARRSITYAQLAERLATIGVDDNERNLRNKVSRGLAVALGLSAGAPLGAEDEQSYALDDKGYENPTYHSAVAGGPFHVGTDAAQADENCEQGEDKRSSDLCAQWKAADAAAESSKAALAQLWVGSIIGLLTLMAAGAAAYYAGWAAIHTGQGVEVTQEMGRAQA